MCCCVLQNKKPRGVVLGVVVPVVAVAVVLVHVLVLVQALVPSIGQVCARPSREHLPVSLLDCAMALLR
jgi:hypothetical protein